ncbi:MAG TPA: hypothetical protein VE974_02435 [Thermoanaerobaculia bacterium]|nr:hypothetical protein [Thermoanaerobaculia bacterium]
MTRWLQSLLLVVLTATASWLLFANREPVNAAPPPVAAAATAPLVEAPPPIPAIQRHEPEPRAYTLRRNLFAYAAAAPVRVERAVFVPVPEPQPVEVVAARIEPETPPPPRFPYRFIGRFGPDANPVAAFARDGEIVTARRGDRVGGFTLRAIGVESVEVAGDAGITRIALGH